MKLKLIPSPPQPIRSNFRALAGCFTDVERLLSDQLDTTTTTTATTGAIDAVLFDFGASSMQYDTATRGFSLSKDGPLNMRMDELVRGVCALHAMGVF